MSKNISELSGRKGLEDNLFDRLGKLAVKNEGSPKQEELDRLAEEFLIGKANTYGSMTFYDFTKPENRGKKAYVCNGSACLCAGTQDNVQQELEKHLQADQIGHMTCLGRCHENGAFYYDGNNYSNLDGDQIKEVLNGAKLGVEDYHVEAHGTAVLTEATGGLGEFKDRLTKVLKSTPEKMLASVKASNIRGRGGAGFPMWIKLDAAAKQEHEEKFIICNADEGDPGAYSDRYLLEQRAESVIFGMLMSGFITGASWGVLYIRAEYPEAADHCQSLLDEMDKLNLVGEDILGTGFNFKFKIIRAQGAYICGEETALINSIEGQRPEVRVRPPYPAEQGLFNRPTVVNNVETLAALYWIAKAGGDAYADLGTDRSSGTKLVCLDSFFNRPGIYEVEMGCPLRTVVDTLGGGFKVPVKGMHIGGPLGGIVPVDKIDDLTVDFESFGSQGFLLGHASVVSIPENYPMIDYLQHLFDFASFESCGKCFPCRLGTKRAHEMLTKAKDGEDNYKIDTYLWEDLLHTLSTGSLCAHGGGIPLPARNAMQYFDSELKAYFN